MSRQSDAAGPGGTGGEHEAQTDACEPVSPPTADELHFFSHTVDGQWRGGWFRIRNGQLEVYAAGQVRTTTLAEASDPDGLLRKLLTEMVRREH